MKKFIIFAAVLALLVPTLAMAAIDVSLGGFIKLDAMWDSDGGVGKNVYLPPARSNDANAKHGRLKFTASGTRFSLTVMGPDLWGAKTSGFIELDFDLAERELLGQGFTASKSYVPRLRHAMFRFNWPTSELLFGQYWPMFTDWWPETAEDGPTQMTGTPTHRLAQIRFTQKFMSDWTVAALIGDPTQTYLGSAANNNTGPYNANTNNGQSAESPRVEGKIVYAHDFWGKAAYYGQPTPFTVQFAGGWQRNVLRTGTVAAYALGENSYIPATPTGVINVKNQYLNPWLAMGSLFIPVMSTQSANLAGTASILTQLWIGQGIEAFGYTGAWSNKYRLNNNLFGGLNYEADLLQKFGGFVQGQYYFTNQWFVNALYAFSKAYNVSRSLNAAGLGGREYAFTADNPQTIQQVELTLWYRPIQAIKFGLEYAYASANYFAYALPTTSNTGVPVGLGAANNVNRSHFGDNHRLEFVAFFFF